MSASSKKKLRKEQNAAALTEKQLSAQKEAKKLRKQTIAFVAVVALILVIGLGSLAVTAYNNSGITERHSTALTIGEHKLSAAELSYFYIDAINSAYNEWYNAYGDYTAQYVAMFYGLDLTKPLSEQMYDEENNKTYADYFIDIAIENAVSTYTMYDQAVSNSVELTDTDETTINYTLANLELTSANAGYRNVAGYLKAVYGNGSTEKSFRDYLELRTLASSFEAETYNNLTYTADDLAAYNEEHFDDFSSFSYSSFYMSPSDFLVCTADEDDEDHEHTEEEEAAALAAAKEAADSIVKFKPATAEDFNREIKRIPAYAENESAACIENVDMLYSNISDGKIAEWLTDSSRKAGDITVIANTRDTTDEDGNTVTEPYSYTVVLFQGRNDNEMKLVNVRHILKAFTGGTTDENGNTVYPKESMEKAYAEITALQELWVTNGKTVENFIELAELNSDDGGSAMNGGLYEDVYPGQMVPAFNNWCFDEARQTGDYTVVETEYGYHLMYFVGHSAKTFRNYMIENTLRNDDFNKWYLEQIEAAEYKVIDTSKVNTDVSVAG